MVLAMFGDGGISVKIVVRTQESFMRRALGEAKKYYNAIPGSNGFKFALAVIATPLLMLGVAKCQGEVEADRLQHGICMECPDCLPDCDPQYGGSNPYD